MPEKDSHPSIGESAEELQQAVETLSQEVRVLRDVLDEIREDFSWALRNGHSESIEKTIASDETVSATEPSTKPVEQDEPEVNPQEEILEDPATSLVVSNPKERIDEHEEWVRTVRDPAEENSEGLRRLRTPDGNAIAEYEIAGLSQNRWAMRFSLAYYCGNMEGVVIPWSVYVSREACVEQFERRTKQFFRKLIDESGNDSQRQARKKMLEHFGNTLFGFVEPYLVPQEQDSNDSATNEIHVGENLHSLKHQILEHLSACVGAVNLHDLRRDLGFPEIDPAEPLANPVHNALVALQNSGHVSTIESDFGEPSFLFQRPLYLRPDRQNNFDGIPHYEWPEPAEDRDTLTVDRVGHNGEGGEHRFTVQRGDTVEVFFSREKQEIGKVVGVSQANREVRVAFQAMTNGRGSEGTWFAIGSIYPALEPASDEDSVPLSDVIEKVNQAITPQEQVWGEADRVPSTSEDTTEVVVPDSDSQDGESLTDHQRTYTLNDFQAFLHRLDSGEITASDLQADFNHLISSQEQLKSALMTENNAQELQVLAFRFGCHDAKRNNKQQNAAAIISSMMLAYTLKNSVTYQPFSGESYDDAIRQVVETISETDIEKYIQDRTDKSEQIKKALQNPETLQEFRQFIAQKGEDQLSHEQLTQYDRLLADLSRAERANRRKATVEQFSGDIDGLKITIKEGYHTRQNIPLWICQLSERIDRATFSDLKFKAKQLGGWWSSFKKEDTGFQFKNEESARKFQSLLQGNADRSEELADRKSRKIETASERLSQLADDLEQAANQSLHQDRLTNTVRRSEMAAGIRGRAYTDIAFAGTLRSLSTALASGEESYLDGIRAKTQLVTLIEVLRRAKQQRNKLLLEGKGELDVWERHQTVEEFEARPLEAEDAYFAEYPYPNIYKRNLEAVISQAASRKGVKQRAAKMKKRIISARDFILFKTDYEIKEFAEFCTRCKDAGIDVQWIEASLDNYKRLHAANIHTLPELRMALRELVPHLQQEQEDDPVLKAEQALVGRKLDGFFPTPKSVISRMLELAEIKPDSRILEPSAGKGDILDMLREFHPDTEVSAIELNSSLFDVLEAKGHIVERGDFLEHSREYDRIVMNPPFERGADIEHVRHAYALLAPNGRLVAIMSEGPFFRSDSQATQFRDWLDELAGESEQLPEDTFNNSEAFRKTGVRTRIVTITK